MVTAAFSPVLPDERPDPDASALVSGLISQTRRFLATPVGAIDTPLLPTMVMGKISSVRPRHNVDLGHDPLAALLRPISTADRCPRQEEGRPACLFITMI